MSSLRHVEQCISRQSALKHLNAFVTPSNLAVARETIARGNDAGSASDLRGRLIALKDNITTLDEPTTCASRALQGYVSTIPSTVSTLLREAGAIVTGKTNMDEFGMGSHSQSPRTGPVINHLARPGIEDSAPLSAGGSSGGGAVAVATGQCWASLGTDTGGSVRLPAAWTGTVGFKPSYGRVSRWGVVDYANSLDTVGILARRVRDAVATYSVLDKHDAQDPTSLSRATRRRLEEIVNSARRRGGADDDSRPLRIGIPLEYNVQGLDPTVSSAWRRTLDSLRRQGHILRPVSLPLTPLALATYYVLAPAEASSNLAKYDGVRYGHRSAGPDASQRGSRTSSAGEDDGEDVLFARTRGEGFGDEVKRRILLGTYTLSSAAYDNYFLRAQKMRRLVRDEFDGVFALRNGLVDGAGGGGDGTADQAERVGGSVVDVLVTPTAPTLPPTLREVAEQSAVERYVGDVFTVPSSLAGLPAINVPVAAAAAAVEPGAGSRGPCDREKTRGRPLVSTVGMQVIGQFGDDETVLRVGELIESLLSPAVEDV